MAKVIVYFAHPGLRFSHVNARMQAVAKTVPGITMVDLYADYPRFHIDTKREQRRLMDHDVILFQFPLFWYSTPALLKEWQDLVLEHGFAYGAGGDKLAGKRMMLAITAAAPEEAFSLQGYQARPLREFLTPLEQTAALCKMDFLAPFVLYDAQKTAETGNIAPHTEGFRKLLVALRDDTLRAPPTGELDVITSHALANAMRG